MDYGVYRKFFLRFPLRSHVYHHTVPSINQQHFDLVNNENFELVIPNASELGCTCSLYSVFLAGEETEDLAEKLLERKRTWLKKLDNFSQKDAVNGLQNLKSLKRGSKKNISIGLRHYIEHIKYDPIAGFEGDRNWLYTGGTITTHPDISGETFIYTSCGNGLSSISRMNLNGGELQRFNFKVNQPVLQISVDPVTSLICVRQKNNVTVLRNGEDHFVAELKKKVRKSKFFTSMACSGGKVALAKNVGSIALLDVQSNKMSHLAKMRLHRDCPVANSWSQLHWEEEGLLIVRGKDISLLDLRGEKLDWKFDEIFDSCEEICVYIRSEKDTTLCYIATTHNLFHVDWRQKKIIYKWTHLMKSVPTFGEAIAWGQSEIVMLHSSNPCEQVIVGCGAEVSQCPPKYLTGLIDSLRDAQLNCFCLDPDVSKRVRYTLTGACHFPVGNAIKQLIQNAAGDVFVREISNEIILENDDDRRESWKKFEECAPIAEKSHYTDILDMSAAMEKLKVHKCSKKNVVEEVHWVMGEQFTIDKLPVYKDALVAPLLDVWGVHASEDEEIEADVDVDMIPMAEKVDEWLKKYVPE